MFKNLYLVGVVIFLLSSCESKKEDRASENNVVASTSTLVLNASEYIEASMPIESSESSKLLLKEGWLTYQAEFPQSGRYRLEFFVTALEEGTILWLEDYHNNTEGRTYNVTGNRKLKEGTNLLTVDGAPFAKGGHPIKLHVENGSVSISKLVFTLMKPHKASPMVFEQSVEGKDWSVVWSDEFDGETLDTTKWTFDIGDWGWGNNELQYYTDSREENARLDSGMLIIEARKDDLGSPWTSARLTTRGKVSFLYGKIEFRAKVPKERGNWAAGWTLGDSYVDEKSWPYSGEIDILETVGYEMDSTSDTGIAHATVHTPAYYFKIENQISSTREVENITEQFHTYAVIWSPTEILGLVDDEVYYTYDKNANEREWPFNKPQNIILNLAMGGGWGGAKGLDESITSQQFIIDYVRVYELK